MEKKGLILPGLLVFQSWTSLGSFTNSGTMSVDPCRKKESFAKDRGL
jgi:hypothetical protein